MKKILFGLFLLTILFYSKQVKAEIKDYGPFLYSSIHEVNGNIAYYYWKGSSRDSHKEYLFFNSMEFGPYDSVNPAFLNIKGKNYGFKYTLNNNDYINFNGKNYGPLGTYSDKLTDSEIKNRTIKIGDKNHGFSYYQNNKFYININGYIFGPYDMTDDPIITDKSWGFIYGYGKDKNGFKTYVKINNKDYGPIPSPDYYWKLSVSDNNWGYSYVKNEKYFINVSGKEYGPFDYAGPFVSVARNNFGFSFDKNDRDYLNINGKESGPFDLPPEFYILDNHYIFTADKNNINIDGKKYGPFDSYDLPDFEYLDNYWYFTYKKGNNKYLNIMGRNFGPYDDIIFNFKSITKTNWIFAYKKNNRYYIYTKNKIYGPYDEIESHDNLIVDGNNWVYYYKKNNNYYINANGKDFGPFGKDKIYMEVRLSGNIFGAYYKKDKKAYISIQGKEYGPYIFSIGLRLSNNKWHFVYGNGKDYYIKEGTSEVKTQNTEGKIIYLSGSDLNIILSHNKKKKDVLLLTKIMKKYTEPYSKNDKKITINQKYAINNFIVYGTISNQHLKVDKRAMVIKDFISKFKKLPKTESDWNVVVKMAKNKK